jgi:hypothetical protein
LFRTNSKSRSDRGNDGNLLTSFILFYLETIILDRRKSESRERRMSKSIQPSSLSEEQEISRSKRRESRSHRGDAGRTSQSPSSLIEFENPIVEQIIKGEPEISVQREREPTRNDQRAIEPSQIDVGAIDENRDQRRSESRERRMSKSVKSSSTREEQELRSKRRESRSYSGNDGSLFALRFLLKYI